MADVQMTSKPEGFEPPIADLFGPPAREL